MLLAENRIDRRNEVGRRLVEAVLQRGSAANELGENRARGRHRQRMLAERAGVERPLDGRIRVVAVLPLAAVDPIEETSARGDDAERHAAADEFAVGRDVGFDAEVRLCAAGMNAEAGDHLVEDQRNAAPGRQVAQRAEEFARVKARAPALHGLDEDGGERVGVGFDDLERLRKIPR